MIDDNGLNIYRTSEILINLFQLQQLNPLNPLNDTKNRHLFYVCRRTVIKVWVSLVIVFAVVSARCLKDNRSWLSTTPRWKQVPTLFLSVTKSKDICGCRMEVSPLRREHQGAIKESSFIAPCEHQ